MTPLIAALPPKAWQAPLLALAVLTSGILALYWPTAEAMVRIWLRSETYAHALVVPLISLWLIWRQRERLSALTPFSSWLLALPIVGFSMLWLLGELTAVNALTQFALVATLVFAIAALLGPTVSKTLGFPLAFLFFAVPFGDFMMPTLMTWTAKFTVIALRATGIPVYQEGLQFVIPSGNWSVVEACSGIRYMIASVTVGTLFAYLNYVSLKRRITFVIVSFLVPVIANWARAYIIVMLGHLSGNKLAAGVDHLIYGWVFFGVVIMIMFMIGARWSESTPESVHVATASATPTLARNIWLPLVGLLALAGFGPLTYQAILLGERVAPVSAIQPMLPQNWDAIELMHDWKPVYANPSREFRSSYRNSAHQVGVYIAYYRNQDYEHKLVTSTNVLAVSKDPVWSVITSEKQPLGIAGMPSEILVSRLVGKTGMPETRLIVWQWYWIDGRLLTSPAEAKFRTALARLMGRGDDSAVIMLYADEFQANKALPAFAEQAAGALHEALQRTRDAR